MKRILRAGRKNALSKPGIKNLDREQNDRTVPHGRRILANDLEPVLEQNCAHLLGRVVGERRVLRHDFVLVGIMNHRVAARLHDLPDISEVAANQGLIDVPKGSK